MPSARTELPALIVPSRFRGPESSANGGYMCGTAAGYLDGPVTVTLHRPPPLDTRLSVEADAAGSVRIRHGDAVVAEATPARDSPPLSVPETVSLEEARAAEGAAQYFQNPMFPTCFVCGPERSPGDGLRIFPGLVPGRALWAAPWTPDASLADGGPTVGPEIAWAALDCPSGIAAAEAADVGSDTAILLGRMTASVAALPAVGEQCHVVAWPVGRDGRKLTAASALLGESGEVLAAARMVWITVPRTGAGTTAAGAS
jgi:hypothetical protein